MRKLLKKTFVEWHASMLRYREDTWHVQKQALLDVKMKAEREVVRLAYSGAYLSWCLGQHGGQTLTCYCFELRTTKLVCCCIPRCIQICSLVVDTPRPPLPERALIVFAIVVPIELYMTTTHLLIPLYFSRWYCDRHVLWPFITEQQVSYHIKTQLSTQHDIMLLCDTSFSPISFICP